MGFGKGVSISPNAGDVLKNPLDGEIIVKMITTDKIADIYYNDDAWRSYEMGDGSQSDADIWLCSGIITHTRVTEQIDRIFRKSVLYRDKWERDDYRRRTIELALPVSDPITLALNGVRYGSAGNLKSIVALAGTEWIYTDLMKKIVGSSKVSPRTAKKRISDLVDVGHMIKQTDGKYTVVAQ
jgi:hypothetical protein